MYEEKLWDEWAAKEIKNYKVTNGKQKYLQKGYLHFDNRFWFPTRLEEIRTILKDKLLYYNPTTKRKEVWSFSPFVKLLIKSPRYKFQDESNEFELETKIRPICFAAHVDSLLLSYYGYALTRKYEQYLATTNFAHCVLAYRANLGLNNIQFAKEAFTEVRKRGVCSAIALDIKGYFDNIDHTILQSKWAKVIGGRLPIDQFKIYNVLTSYSYVAANSLMKKFRPKPKRGESMPVNYLSIIPGRTTHEKYDYLRENKLIVTNKKPGIKQGKGIPQGSAISSVLSNIYLVDFDEELQQKAVKEGFYYRRYCDDILIVCETRDADTLKKYCIDRISSDDYKLTIQDKKVELIDFCKNSKGDIRGFKRNRLDSSQPAQVNPTNEKRFYKGLQYLGFEFNGKSILIRPSSLSRYFRKMKGRLVKTVSMAYGRAEQSDKIQLRQILERYSHFGGRNFISYAYRSASPAYKNSKNVEREGMDSPAIKRQLERHMAILKNELYKKNEQAFKKKDRKEKDPTFKSVKL